MNCDDCNNNNNISNTNNNNNIKCGTLEGDSNNIDVCHCMYTTVYDSEKS